MANVIIKSEERIRKERETLSQYGVNPDRASAEQRELAAAINNGVNTAFNEMRRNER